MQYRLQFTPVAADSLDALEKDPNQKNKLKKVLKTLSLLEANPRHGGLHSHRYESLSGPSGEAVWESYVENHTPGAWRIWWWYGPGQGEITILTLAPHPD